MEPTTSVPDALAKRKEKDPDMPPMHRVGDVIAPNAPQNVAQAGLEEGALGDLVTKLAWGVARFTPEWIAKKLHLSLPLVRQVITQLALDGLLEEVLGTTRYKITPRGRDQAVRLFDVCGYVGPAPVRLEAYAAMLRWQFAHSPEVHPEDVTAALSGLVIAPEAGQLAGLAVSSGSSLFVHGPSGNGKSSLGRMIHSAMRGDIWIPYCLSVGNTVVRLFDDQCHQRVEVEAERPEAIDQRWVRIRRPLIIVGGELTLEMLDLIFSPSMRYYEAPPHLKANGGVFLVDDFGRERVSPDQLLNRFITPMEHQHDYLTLETGQKIEVPLRHVLIIATNLSPETVTDPAFLRRMGYRIYLGPPTPEGYALIFRQYAEHLGMGVPPKVIDGLLDRYRAQKRDLRACEPRDLIERARHICHFQGKPMQLTSEVLDLAWIGYFGNQ